ncbi:TetR/AcrR family transcriptional regulator [Pseudomonas sp. BCA14]|uniref:TetR/AcrR family transcriptional regulator n=1 Tax=unclassified Pseudomonas TaxID=196821 RepID=UPI00106EFEA3|nr:MULTISPECIES: TetR/AcrR family transcriptional regulator [unclassified Pseudomonas]TFF06776.1 TetR/AcrR family transcriptional regulator [Pseudomonas sp. BCA17]TFF09214.1 TetR/AcrR family transcriptional regulator [Pseudomonas sp. JMN1]TFF19328.1 TetR/AcrR family transcriptional regulator [Pseudomonas sp. BCA14]TFF21444.1 TetR/AcrR family transcriptional regulator [Pseudomonas sp. BCA13]
MSSHESPAPRRRLSREDRFRQLLDVAWQLVREEGTDALTLGRLAELAGVTKPVVYDHFVTRAGLLAALYEDFDRRQNQQFAEAIEASAATLEDRAWVIAACYVDCVLLQGREIPGVIAALSSSPELETLKRRYEAIFLDKCRDALSPYAPGAQVTQAGLRAMLGAAEALSHAAASGEISREEAQQELLATILAMVNRGSNGRAVRSTTVL